MNRPYQPMGYDPAKSAGKGVAEGGFTALWATVIYSTMLAVQAKNPDLTLGPQGDMAVLGLSTALITGISKWWRNRSKHKP